VPPSRPLPSGRVLSGGFTLLEVVISLAIFGAGIAALLAMFSGSLRLSEGARDVSVATVYASQRMEEALLVPRPSPGEETGFFGERFRWTTRTSYLPPEEESPYVPVRVEVILSWGEGDDVRSVDLTAVRWERLEGNADR